MGSGRAGKNKSEVQRLKDMVRELRVENEEHAQKKKDLKEKCDALRLERHLLEVKILELEASKHGREELVTDLQGNFAKVAQNNKSGKEETDALHLENRELKDTISKMGAKGANEWAQLLKGKTELQQKIVDNEVLTRKIEELEEKLSNLEHDHRHYYNLSEELKKCNDESSQKAKDLEERSSSAEQNHQYYYSLSEKNNHELSRKNKMLEEKVLRLEQNASEEPKIGNDELSQINKELEQKVLSLEHHHQYRSDLSECEERKREIEELRQKNQQLEEKVITLGAEKQDLELTKQLCEESQEGKQNKIRQLNRRLAEQQPLVKLALDVRQRFWQHTMEELGLGTADDALVRAGDAAANRPNCQVDTALIALGSQQSPLVSSPYGFIGAGDFTMSPESFEILYDASCTNGMFETGHHLDIELTNIFAYSKLCLAKSHGRRELEEIAERILYLGRNVISDGFSELVHSGINISAVDWDGTWFKTPNGCDATTSAAFDKIRATMVELRETLESLARKATWSESLL